VTTLTKQHGSKTVASITERTNMNTSNSKILLTFESGKLVSAVANGNVKIYVENTDILSGIIQVSVQEITNSDFDSLLAGRMPTGIESEP
jgi:hypothetical protein